MQDIFEKFLLENNCYSQFVTNLLEQKHLTIEEHISKTKTHYDTRFLVFDAFNWRYTPEKGEFWAIIHNEWEALCTRLKIYL